MRLQLTEKQAHMPLTIWICQVNFCHAYGTSGLRMPWTCPNGRQHHQKLCQSISDIMDYFLASAGDDRPVKSNLQNCNWT